MGAQKPLYLISDGYRLRSQGKLVSAIKAALEGGEGCIGYVQIREQNQFQAEMRGGQRASDAEILKILAELKPICESHGAKLLLNSRVDLAVQAKIDGVHLGAKTVSIRDAKRELPHFSVIGYSAHCPEEAFVASVAGADYVFLSPIFPPNSKPADRPPLGVVALEQTCSTLQCPVFALGGISAQNAASCRHAGAQGVAMIGSVLLDPDPFHAAAKIVASWKSGNA